MGRSFPLNFNTIRPPVEDTEAVAMVMMCLYICMCVCVCVLELILCAKKDSPNARPPRTVGSGMEG